MRRGRDRSIEIKTPAQLAIMREAGLVTAAALRAAAAAVEPGVSTAELDAIAERVIRDAGAVPSFLGYHGYPGTICTSVNDQVVHGIPSRDARLKAGDLISIDCGAIVAGWHGDAALTVSVGPAGPDQAALLAACEDALWHGLARALPGGRLTDISAAVEAAARAAGPFGIIEDYTGHGIGRQMHMDPPVPNYGRPGRGPVLTEGMALAVEPMLVLGQPDAHVLADDWTVVTDDGGWAAHFEHTVAITADGPWVLTAEDGGASGLARVRAHAPGQPNGAVVGRVRDGARGSRETPASPGVTAPPGLKSDQRGTSAGATREGGALKRPSGSRKTQPVPAGLQGSAEGS